MRAAEPLPPPPFAGFRPAAFAFFRDLAANQDRAWFAERKATYETAVRAPLASLVAGLSDALAKAGVELRGDPGRGLFRIQRDVRFSKDKSPFKTHAGAVLTRDGGKSSPGLLYVHLDPTGCFVAAGFYQPEPASLELLRRHLLDEPAAWARVREKLAAGGLSLEATDTLVRPPKGFDEVPEAMLATLKLKSWVVRRALPRKAFGDAQLIPTLVGFAETALPLLRFGWAALEGKPPRRG